MREMHRLSYHLAHFHSLLIIIIICTYPETTVTVVVHAIEASILRRRKVAKISHFLANNLFLFVELKYIANQQYFAFLDWQYPVNAGKRLSFLLTLSYTVPYLLLLESFILCGSLISTAYYSLLRLYALSQSTPIDDGRKKSKDEEKVGKEGGSAGHHVKCTLYNSKLYEDTVSTTEDVLGATD